MKNFLCLFVVILIGSSTVSILAREPISGKGDSAKEESAATLAEGDIIEAWGWLVARQRDVSEAELSQAELAAFERGLKDCLLNRAPAWDLSAISADVERFSVSRRQKYWKAVEEKNTAAGRAFMAALVHKSLVELGGGAKFEIVRPNHGKRPLPQETVTVHYVGRLVDGSDFAELGPYDLVLVPNRVLPALFEGLLRMHVGERARIYVPPVLPAVNETRPGVARGALTIYDVELLDIKPTSAEDLANSLLPPAPDPSAPPPSGASDEQIAGAWGWSTALKSRAVGLKLKGTEVDRFVVGVLDGVKGAACKSEEREIVPIVEKYVTERRRAVEQALLKERADEMNAFLAELKSDPQVRVLPDGLRFKILNPGKGPNPKHGQTVVVDYTGRLINGTIFDKTYNEPLHIQLGLVIPGLSEGIQQIAKGGRIKLFIPPSIGYGNENVSGVVSKIPAGSLLIYELELLDILDEEKSETEK
ncbi:MAG: FKBP-type peptidyl-prolyl cis-trans isomerase [Nibricoccus sp.]